MLTLLPDKAPWPRPRVVPPSPSDTTREINVAFLSNEPIEDVKERFMDYAGATYTNFAQRTSGGGYFSDRLHALDAGDFTIQLKFSLTGSFAGFGAASIIGAANASPPDSNGAWLVRWETSGQLAFYMATATGLKFVLAPLASDAVAINTNHHLEIGRKDGVVYIFFNGTLIGSKLVEGKSNSRGITHPLSMQRSGTFYGARWDFKIDKGVCLHTANFTPDMTVVPYARPVYSQADADLIRSQFQFRRDSFENEAGRRLLQVRNGTTYVIAGKLQHNITYSSSTTGYYWLTDQWGQGDFTVECSFNFASVAATGGAMLMGHWNLGTATHDDNRWALIINPAGKLSMTLAKSTDGQNTDSILLSFTCIAGTVYRAIAERVNGVLTLYLLDGLTGDVLDQATLTTSTPVRGNAPHRVASWGAAGSYWGGTYTLWDIRISDKAQYSGVPRLLPVFPAFDDKYTQAEEDNIVNQTTLRYSNRDEKTGYQFIPNSVNDIIANGTFAQIADTTSRGFSQERPGPFGAADFTIECRFTPLSGAGSIWGQFDSSGTANNSSWKFQIAASKVQVVFSQLGKYNTGLTTLEAPVAVTYGREYYYVVERVNGVTTLYQDGVAVATTAVVNYPLIDSPNPISRLGQGAIAMQLRDMRISKTSQYKGVVPSSPKYKFFRKQRQSLAINYTNGYGTLYGFLENSFYTTTYNLSIGHVARKRFNYNGKIRRLKGLFVDRGSFLILGWEDTTIDAPNDMPIWSNQVLVNGALFDTNAGSVSGFTTPLGGTSVYWGSVPFPLTDGRQIAWEFVDNLNLIEDGVPNAVATRTGSMRTVDNELRLSNSYFAMPDSTNYTIGASDFTIDMECTVYGVTPAASSNIVGFVYWGTWAAPSQQVNYDFYYNYDSKQFVFSTDYNDVAQQKIWSFDLQLGRKYVVQLTRDAGSLQLWIDGVNIGSYTFTTSITRDVAGAFNVGRRIGGTTGNVSWLNDIGFKRLRVVKRKLSAL